MEAFGRHIVAELSNCRADRLEDINFIRRILIEAARAANAEVLKVVMHKFSPQGVTGVVVIAESHLSIHTWPESGYAAVDIYTCGSKTVPQKAYEYIAKKIEAQDVFVSEIHRGIPDIHNVYHHDFKTKKMRRRSMLVGAGV